MDITVHSQGRQLQVIILPSRSPCLVNISSISASRPIEGVIKTVWMPKIIRPGSRSRTLTSTKQQRQIMPALKIRSIVEVAVISKDSMILLRGPPKTRNRLWMLHRQLSRIQLSSKARRTATTSKIVWRTIALELLKWTNTTQQEAAISWLWALQKPPKA